MTPSNVKDITGQRFARLVALERAGEKWRCLCDCGTVKWINGYSLRCGVTKSCGCLRRASAPKVTHGMSYTSEYQCWANMIARCDNPKNTYYKDYGGRGIVVCKRWYRFENFHADMGSRPQGLTLDRIDNDGNYEPGNCRWADHKTQTANRRRREVLS